MTRIRVVTYYYIIYDLDLDVAHELRKLFHNNP